KQHRRDRVLFALREICSRTGIGLCRCDLPERAAGARKVSADKKVPPGAASASLPKHGDSLVARASAFVALQPDSGCSGRSPALSVAPSVLRFCSGVGPSPKSPARQANSRLEDKGRAAVYL